MINRFQGFCHEFSLYKSLRFAGPGWILPSFGFQNDVKGMEHSFYSIEECHRGQSDVFINFHRREMFSQILERLRILWALVGWWGSVMEIPCLPRIPWPWILGSFPGALDTTQVPGKCSVSLSLSKTPSQAPCILSLMTCQNPVSQTLTPRISMWIFSEQDWQGSLQPRRLNCHKIQIIILSTV